MEQCLDADTWEKYQGEVQSKCQELLVNLGLSLGEDNAECEHNELTVTTHAGIRWIERRLHITGEGVTYEYLKTNKKNVTEQIMSEYSKSECIWSGEDYVKYYLSPDNMMFVVDESTEDKRLVTLYEEDFGWGKERNRWLIESQLKTIAQCKEEVHLAEKEHIEEGSRMASTLDALLKEKRVLDAQTAAIVSQIELVKAQDEERYRVLVLKREKFAKEFGMLFSNKEFKTLKWGGMDE
jgi:hypothetical protein